MVPGDTSRPARHPLLEAAIDAYPPPDHLGVEITVDSAMPAGCGAGTSAAVAMAVLGALRAARVESTAPREMAYAAHDIEVGVLGGESGIQDQLCVAFGGINYFEIDPYPEATVFPLPPWDELGSRLTLVYLGRAHDSAALHRKVISEVTTLGAEISIRCGTPPSPPGMQSGPTDLGAFGRAMVQNTDAQSSLDPGLVGVDARKVIRIASDHGALGWKVNGAGETADRSPS